MENKKTKIVSIIAIIALVLTVITATYAYFQAPPGEGSQADVKINASTIDTLTFETGSAISLSLDQTGFAQGTGNKTSSTFAKAILTANNKTNSATDHYYMYLNIENNTFTYTQNESTPEILLTIKDESNNEITSISGLIHTSVTDASGVSITGFDITNKSGLITIFDNREITTTSSKTEQWNVMVTYVNYDADQSANAGKSFSAKLEIQKDEYNQTLADYVISQFTGTQGENAIYFHDLTLANGASDNSYRYAGPSEEVNNFVCFGTNASPCPTDNLYRIIGVFGGNYHGVSGEQLVKLIKYDYANSNLLGTDGDYYGSETPNSDYKGNLASVNTYYWNYKATGSVSNTWSTSLLNKINLNTNFINNIGTEWANKIAVTKWKVGGNTKAKIYNVKASETYQNEIINPDATNSTDNATEYSAKIGLMYASEYGFAASPSEWSKTLNNYEVIGIFEPSILTMDWIHMGRIEWTITRYSDTLNDLFYVNFTAEITDYYGVRPSFNLAPSVTYKSGSGTMSDPILIN